MDILEFHTPHPWIILKKLWKETNIKHSDLYVTHFYAARKNAPGEYDLYIVMKRCDEILSRLIKKVHRSKKYGVRKFPTIFLKDSLIGTTWQFLTTFDN